MGSSRLPGKVLSDIEGYPMLQHVLIRLKAVSSIDRMVVATSDLTADEPIASLCDKTGDACFRGSEKDVLDRFYQVASLFGADTVVRITADCPMIDPQIVEWVISVYRDGPWDYVSNTVDRSFPDGLDVEVFSYSALKKAWEEASLRSEREHVTPYIWKNKLLFKRIQVIQREDLSDLRWTVDEPQDMEMIRRIYRFLYDGRQLFLTTDILRLLEEHPEISQINRDLVCNEGYLKSVRTDRCIRSAFDNDLGGI